MPHAVGSIDTRGPGNWRTPPSLAQQIVKRYALNYDAFADPNNAVCGSFSSTEGTFDFFQGILVERSDKDGLDESWEGRRVFLNPPYTAGFIPKAIAKCLRERNKADIIVALLSADTSTITWRKVIEPNAESITFLPRIKFWLPDGSGPGGSPNFGSALIVFKKDYRVNSKDDNKTSNTIANKEG